MKDVIKNKIALSVAIVGLIGGAFWCYKTQFDIEPTLLLVISAIEILGYYFYPGENEIENGFVDNRQNVIINIATGSENNPSLQNLPNDGIVLTRQEIIEHMSNRVSILFIDDDTNFNVVKILKESGWKKSKTIPDIKNLDVQSVKDAEIIFVDINGVGKILNLEFEGLDLALMLKQKYPNKKIVIYSANRNSNSFHSAWDICDFKLEKNALPYQFQNLVEEYSIEFFNCRK